MSAYIAHAVEQKTSKDALDELLDEWLEESGGPPTLAERNWARKQLGLPPLRKSVRKRGKVRR